MADAPAFRRRHRPARAGSASSPRSRCPPTASGAARSGWPPWPPPGTPGARRRRGLLPGPRPVREHHLRRRPVRRHRDAGRRGAPVWCYSLRPDGAGGPAGPSGPGGAGGATARPAGAASTTQPARTTRPARAVAGRRAAGRRRGPRRRHHRAGGGGRRRCRRRGLGPRSPGSARRSRAPGRLLHVVGGDLAASDTGLAPIDVAMAVAIPEFDGRIIGVPVSHSRRWSTTATRSGCAGHRLPDGARPGRSGRRPGRAAGPAASMRPPGQGGSPSSCPPTRPSAAGSATPSASTRPASVIGLSTPCAAPATGSTASPPTATP